MKEKWDGGLAVLFLFALTFPFESYCGDDGDGDRNRCDYGNNDIRGYFANFRSGAQCYNNFMCTVRVAEGDNP